MEKDCLSGLKFADDVVLTIESVKDMKHQLTNVKKIGLEIHQGKTKCTTNTDTTDNLQIDGTEIEKEQEASIRLKAGWSVFGKHRDMFRDRHLPMSLKRKVFNQCVLRAMACGC